MRRFVEQLAGVLEGGVLGVDGAELGGEEGVVGDPNFEELRVQVSNVSWA